MKRTQTKEDRAVVGNEAAPAAFCKDCGLNVFHLEHGAEEIQDLVPSVYELVQLVKAWYRGRLENRLMTLLSGGTGCCEESYDRFAHSRIDEISELIGPEPVSEGMHQVLQEFKSLIDLAGYLPLKASAAYENWIQRRIHKLSELPIIDD